MSSLEIHNNDREGELPFYRGEVLNHEYHEKVENAILQAFYRLHIEKLRFFRTAEMFPDIIGPREEILKEVPVGVISMLHKLIQSVFEVVKDFQLICLCCFNYTVEN